ncbi:hypothetical protein VNO77_35439 [Canavalia gladiata]|uniref:Uncharacterized protein n=1 Tax=Canavalia gladiata TaxID=3824 RepID=A0AAN9KIL2_CANGL
MLCMLIRPVNTLVDGSPLEFLPMFVVWQFPCHWLWSMMNIAVSVSTAFLVNLVGNNLALLVFGRCKPIIELELKKHCRTLNLVCDSIASLSRRPFRSSIDKSQKNVFCTSTLLDYVKGKRFV